jgi:glutathione S-transferase
MNEKDMILFIIPGACSFGSMVALELAQCPYKIGVTTAEVRASESFKLINPTGKVAALKDGDSVIGENLAILLYIADKYSQNSMCPPVGSIGRAKIYQWLSYLSSTLHPAFGQVLYANRFVEEDYVPKFRAVALEKLINTISYIEQNLSPSGLLTSYDFSIADGQAYGLLRWALIEREGKPLIDLKTKFPKLYSYLKLVESHTAVNNALAIEMQELDRLNRNLSSFSGYYSFDI